METKSPVPARTNGTGHRYPDSKRADSVEAGWEFEDFVVLKFQECLHIPLQIMRSRHYQYFVGETAQGVEIKLDSRSAQTQRLSIETAEKTRASNGHWVPSGIYRDDNSWLYVQGSRDIFFLFAKSTLKLLHRAGENGVYRYQRKEELTLQSFYLPFADAFLYAAKVLDFRASADTGDAS